MGKKLKRMVSGWCKGKALVCHHLSKDHDIWHKNSLQGVAYSQAKNTYSTSRELVPLACKDGVD